MTFVQSLGSIMRSILDFNSYTSVGGSNKQTPTVEEFYGFTRIVSPDVPMWERLAEQNRLLEKKRAEYEAERAM